MTDDTQTEPVNLFGDPISADTRTPFDHVERALTKFQETLDLQTAEQQARYDNLQDAIYAAKGQSAVDAALDGLTGNPEPEAEVLNAIYCATEPTASVHLSFPFEAEGVMIERIDFRPPAFADVQAVLDGKKTELEMHAEMTGIPVQALRALRWPDLELVSVIARHMAPEMGRR